MEIETNDRAVLPAFVSDIEMLLREAPGSKKNNPSSAHVAPIERGRPKADSDCIKTGGAGKASDGEEG